MYCANSLFHTMRCSLLLVALTCWLAACGGGGGGAGTAGGGGTVNTPAPNTMPVIVDAGPTAQEVNRLYTSVTLCIPQTTTCQTIDHIVVDTGSSGLRVLASVLSPAMVLPRSTLAGDPLLNCVQYADSSFTWGPMAQADVKLGNETVSSLALQLIADPSVKALSSLCASGSQQATPQDMGANGILGVGVNTEDCGPGCTTVADNGFYYACTTPSCQAASGTTVPLAQQLKNPVAMLATDNNGIVIDLPAVNGQSAATLSGTMYLGVGTQTNNQITGPHNIATNAIGNFSTTFGTRVYSTSYADTGSNGYYMDTTALPVCSGTASGFYCPSATQSFSATLYGGNGVSQSEHFSVANAVSLFNATGSDAVLPQLAGPAGDAPTFAWGLPFFFGKRVGEVLEAHSSGLGAGPRIAY